MNLSIIVILLAFVFPFTVALVKNSHKGNIAIAAVLANSLLSSWIAVQAINGRLFEQQFYGGAVFGEIAIRVDALSGWFILLINFTTLTGILYGKHYMKPYENQPANITLHYSCYILNHFAMIGILCVQHALAFLCVWEVMALSSFMMVIFEHEKMDTLKAGINYLIQSHISIMFLTVAFIWVNSHTGSYDFNAISQYTSKAQPALSFLLFLCFFIGFAIKAGFVPFHTWLPYAHPVAPSHVSGIMSGVVIKLGIFGILRILLLIKVNYMLMGYTLLVFSAISGVYGVTLAIIQHNLKKLLAYHSIENIGIIGMGIGLGCIGVGMNNSFLAFAGFAGALLHTLNHSLFKSLLFYTAGTVYQATHTMDIEQLGGLIKKMPHTATLFLIGALAICGLPPFNGFISELLIYSGLFNGIVTNPLSSSITLVSVLFALALIGGLAMLCFTKAFGVIFLGTIRDPNTLPVREAGWAQILPKYMVALPIILIGILPQLFIRLLSPVVALFMKHQSLPAISAQLAGNLQTVGLAGGSFLLLCIIIFRLKRKITSSKAISTSSTWACGYPASTPRFQYTANSFVRSYRKLVSPLLMMNKSEGEIKDVFPQPVHSVTHPYDKLEAIFIDTPIRYLKKFLRLFDFLQNGSEQFYILYGVVFIIIVIAIPILIDAAIHLMGLSKQI